MKKIVAIVQARMGSTRLPEKVMKAINGATVIELLLARLLKSELIDLVVVATSEDKKNRRLVDHVRQLGFNCEQGSENDVLERFHQTAEKYDADIVVRITGDCPLLDPQLVDDVIKGYLSADVDYFSNVLPPTYPDGLDVEVFSRAALDKAYLETADSSDREHVTPYIRNSGKFSISGITYKEDLSDLRWTLDEPEDFELISVIFNRFSPNLYFSWLDILDYYYAKPHIFEVNRMIDRNEGAVMGTGQKLYKRAKKVIPGGNMLLSKRPEMFLPELWPSYFSKAKGSVVWDLDGKRYIDMSIMGIGTNILGYGHEEVDNAVAKVVTDGNMSTLNCPEEVYLAEKLVEMHPWADMVKYARSGGEANALAIRIARAASGRDKVAICGYHGWHDWYLAANLNADGDNSLDGHLLPGLEVSGVPKNLRGTVFPFHYNNFDELENLVKEENIGVIKMEVIRNQGPENNFLKKVRDLATQHNIVLIFDECTSGFRETFGGIHKKYNVEPDIAMFGKAIGNGYALTAVLGRKEIMESAQSTFISSTFWTERIGPVAALKTLEIMERDRSWETITKSGLNIRNGIQSLADKHGLPIESWGLLALTGYTFSSSQSLEYKTLVTQEMLKKGYLAANSTYVSTTHTPELVHGYLDALDSIFELIKECEDGRDVKSLLEGEVCHSGFKRLN
ncbi:aminotransferase class III-fold pyridoxal phosphate-dependent enzyme [Gammaproteobacteria bacterium]|nr:aminotransferase class III-fold pyridoxal phosphate-dependent enzyme [Gammaproteobacteria bacterium]